MTVDAVHYLQVASGGALPPSAVAAGRFTVPWSDIWIALLKISSIDAGLLGTPCATRFSHLRAMHDAFQRAIAGGMTFAVVGSYSAALAVFVRLSRALAQANPLQWVITPATLQALPPAPAAPAANLPAECQWFISLEFGMEKQAVQATVATGAATAGPARDTASSTSDAAHNIEVLELKLQIAKLKRQRVLDL